MTSKVIGVFLGRMAPLHKGHQKIINMLIKDFGIENSLILIGSSNVYNDRTPFTYNAREWMVRTLYPDLKVLAFPDVNPELKHFESKTLEKWLENLKLLENKMNANFIFYGGSEEDLSYLKKYFKTKVTTDRTEGPNKISATSVRRNLKEKNLLALKSQIDVKIMDFVIDEFRKYSINSNANV